MRLTHSLWRARPLVLAIVATIGAAALVLYFQYRAIATLESQTQVIVRQISEQAAADIAAELHRALAGPVLDTLTAVSQPDLRAGRLDLVAQEYKEALAAYPHVDRFLAWSTGTEAATPGEVLFFGRDGRFTRDPRSAAPCSSWRGGTRRPSTFSWRPKAWGRASAIKCCCACSGTTRSDSITSPCSASSSIRRRRRRNCSKRRAARASTRCWPAAPATRRFACA